MALQLILGPSGSGKSAYLFRQALKSARLHPGRRMIVLVPEQFTMQTQRELVMLSEEKGILDIDVLSFTRLAYRVFEETGVPARSVLTETGKSLLLRRVAAQEASGLSLLKNRLDKPGTIAEIKSILSELDQYGVGGDELDQMIAQCAHRRQLQVKLTEIAQLRRAFRAYEADRFITAQELPRVLCAALEKSRANGTDLSLRGCEFFLDSYTGFTPPQLEVLKALFPLAARVSVTVTIDPDEKLSGAIGEHELFAMSKRTIRALTESARETGTEILEPLRLGREGGGRFAESPELQYLEKHILRYRPAASPCPAPEGESAVRLVECRDITEEVRTAAELIVRETREKGLKYREIAVVAGDLPAYAEYVRRTFTAYGIPFFLDKNVPVLLNPALEFVRAALSLCRAGYRAENVLRLLRTGFAGLSAEETDRLENYVLAAGIRTRRAWSEPWTRTTRTMDAGEAQAAEALRARFMERFAPFEEAFREGKTLLEMAQALLGLMESFDLQGQLEAIADEAAAAGEALRAREYEQIYPVILNVMDEAVDLLGEEKIPRSQFEQILEAGFEEAGIGMIPPGTDQVFVGDLERTRLAPVRTMFFIGMNDALVPARPRQGGILSERERSFLISSGLSLAPTARENACIRQFYLYLTLTKPSARLYLLWPRSTADGKAAGPSSLIGEVRTLLPQVRTQTPERGVLGGVTDTRSALEALARTLAELTGGEITDDGRTERALREVLKLYLAPDGPADRAQRDRAMQILEAALPVPAEIRLDPSLPVLLYGRQMRGSVSRLESFAECAFRHFARYGLRLEERETGEVRAADVGNVLHEALEAFSERLARSVYRWDSLPDEVRETWAEEAVDGALQGQTGDLFADSARSRAMAGRLKQILKKSAWALQAQVKAGSFVPSAFEVTFDGQDGLRAANIDLPGGQRLTLRGRIDRVDTCGEDSRLLSVRVIDYKSGSTSFDLPQLVAGTQLQLAVYMNAACMLEAMAHPERTVACAGLFYYRLKDPILDGRRGESEAEYRGRLLRELRLDGLVNSDGNMAELQDHVESSGSSRVIPVGRDKNNGFDARRSHVASGEQLRTMGAYADALVRSLAGRVAEGEIVPAPVRQGEMTVCDRCEFASLCHFEAGRDGMHWREIPKLTEDEAWAAMYEAIEPERDYEQGMDE